MTNTHFSLTIRGITSNFQFPYILQIIQTSYEAQGCHGYTMYDSYKKIHSLNL